MLRKFKILTVLLNHRREETPTLQNTDHDADVYFARSMET